MTHRAPQRGVALITALLIVAIVAIVAMLLGLGQQMWLRQTQNLSDLSQTESLRVSALDFVALMLMEDAKAGTTDHLREKWNEKQQLQVAGTDGVVAITIVDAQARFNLNNLVQGSSGAVNTRQLQTYRDLLITLGLAPTLADTLRDWIDADTNTDPNGAEDLDYYLNLKTPRRAANRPLTSFDELRLVKGYDEATIKKLRPYVVVLPSGDAIKVNVNTAEVPVLAAIAKIPIGQMESIVSGRPFANVEDFTRLLGANSRVTDTFDVATSYFIVSTDILIGRTQRSTEGLIERPTGGNEPARILRSGPSPIDIDFDEDKKS